MSAASFDRAARTYSEHAAVQEDMAAWLAKWLPRRRRGRALEIGAGPGTFTRRILPWTGTLLATDLSAAMCEAGRLAVPEVVWRKMAADSLEEGPWDWILSSSMLQWAAHPEAILSAWKTALAPGGRVLAGLYLKGTVAELDGCLGNSTLSWRTADEWRNLIISSGLRMVREAEDLRIFSYPSATAFLRSLHGVGAAVPGRMRPARLRSLLKAYERQHGCPEGVRASWNFYRFEATAA